MIYSIIVWMVAFITEWETAIKESIINMAKEAFCVSFAIFLPYFQKKPFLRASKGKINAKSPADAEDPPGGLFMGIYL